MKIECRDYGPKNKHPLSRKDDALEVFVLGAGGAFSRKYDNTNYLVVKGDTHVLIDFGVTGPRALWKRAGRLPSDTQAVFPTHAHSDHVGGVENLALMHRYVTRTKPDLITEPRFQHVLWENVLRGGCEFGIDGDGEGKLLGLESYFNLVGFYDRISYKGIHFQTFQGSHMPKAHGASFYSLGIVIDDRVFLSGDSTLDAERLKQYAHCEAFFHDCSFPKVTTHAHFDDLRKLPKEIRRKTVLVHYGDEKSEISEHAMAGMIFAKAGCSYVF